MMNNMELSSFFRLSNVLLWTWLLWFCFCPWRRGLLILHNIILYKFSIPTLNSCCCIWWLSTCYAKVCLLFFQWSRIGFTIICIHTWLSVKFVTFSFSIVYALYLFWITIQYVRFTIVFNFFRFIASIPFLFFHS